MSYIHSTLQIFSWLTPHTNVNSRAMHKAVQLKNTHSPINAGSIRFYRNSRFFNISFINEVDTRCLCGVSASLSYKLHITNQSEHYRKVRNLINTVSWCCFDYSDTNHWFVHQRTKKTSSHFLTFATCIVDAIDEKAIASRKKLTLKMFGDLTVTPRTWEMEPLFPFVWKCCYVVMIQKSYSFSYVEFC